MAGIRRRHAGLAGIAGAALLVAAGCRPAEPPPDRPAAAPAAAANPNPAAPIAADPRPQPPGPPREITFDDLKLDLEKGAAFSRDLLPKRVAALEQQRVRIRGYILPSFQQSGITQFVLVRDNQECCFGPGALLHDCIVVRMRAGRSTNFSIRPVAVTGSFRIDELRGPDGRHLAIYAIDGEAVQ